MNEQTPIVQCKEITYRYDYDVVLENINLTVNEGDFLAIVGPNGSGKSTLLKLILGLLKKQTGSISLFGEEITDFQKWGKIGFVSQKSNSFNTGFPATVYEVVRSGLTKKAGLFHFFPKDTKEQVMEALKAVDLEKYVHRNIGELSGGQQQRVFIARAIVSEPKLLILDEPTVGVDIKRVHAFYHLLSKLNEEKGITLILVTHDVGTITSKVSHIAFLNRTLQFYGTSKKFDQLNREEMSFFYGFDHGGLTNKKETNYEGAGI